MLRFVAIRGFVTAIIDFGLAKLFGNRVIETEEELRPHVPPNDEFLLAELKIGDMVTLNDLV